MWYRMPRIYSYRLLGESHRDHGDLIHMRAAARIRELYLKHQVQIYTSSHGNPIYKLY